MINASTARCLYLDPLCQIIETFSVVRIIVIDWYYKRLLDTCDPPYQILQVGLVDACFLYRYSILSDGD